VDKKPLIGVSICAVVLLVLGSLSNVVGYQSVKSTAMSESPLFSVRTKRATNQQQNIINSQYIGMGKDTLMQFPTRDNRNELLRNCIEIISKMDESTFKRLIEEYIQKIRQENTLRDTDSNEISQTFRQLKTKPETIMNTFIYGNNFNQIALFHYTCNDMTSGNWYPGCFFYEILLSIYWLIEFIFFIFIYKITPTNLYPEFCDYNLF
jgi:hypothetical protein